MTAFALLLLAAADLLVTAQGVPFVQAKLDKQSDEQPSYCYGKQNDSCYK